MTSVHPLGPITDGAPLNITVLSCVDELQIGLVACPSAVPELEEFPALLSAALDELLVECE